MPTGGMQIRNKFFVGKCGATVRAGVFGAWVLLAEIQR
jgi:hypothetical protein